MYSITAIRVDGKSEHASLAGSSHHSVHNDSPHVEGHTRVMSSVAAAVTLHVRPLVAILTCPSVPTGILHQGALQDRWSMCCTLLSNLCMRN